MDLGAAQLFIVAGTLACLIGMAVVSAAALVADRRGRHLWSRGLVETARRHRTNLIAFGVTSLAFGMLVQILAALLLLED